MAELPEFKETFGSCVYCGSSPTNHKLSFFIQTIQTATGVGMYRISRIRFIRWFFNITERISDISNHPFHVLSGYAGIMHFNRADPSKAASYRSQVIWEEAIRQNIPMEQIIIYGKHIEAYRAYIKNKWHYFHSIPIPPWLDTTNYFWIDDKFLLKKLFDAHQVPVPKCISVTSQSAAIRALHTVGGRAIVKPRIGSRGRHTTTNISTEADMTKAYECAKVLNHFVVVEEHLVGNVCRATVVDGELVGFYEAHAPSVVGNGVDTITELINQKNRIRHERVQDITLTEEHALFIERQGFTEQSIPKMDEHIFLSHRIGRFFGAETRELLSDVHPKLRSHIEHAGRVLAVPIVGFDLIIERPTEDPDEQRWGIIEANSLPFIDLHYLPLHGTPSNPAKAVWNLWNKK